MYSRELDGKTLTLAPSGWTYGARERRSIFVLYDRETGSLWFPFGDGKGLTGISGPHADRVVRTAVRGMLPKNSLGRKMLLKLKVYAGPQHPHAAQQPQELPLG